jgi:RNA polymerase sigma factor (sigma-70 family)
MASKSDVESLVDRHREFLAFLERRVGNRATAEEILQAAFVKTVEKGESIRDGESAVAWFYRLLRNAIIDRWRKAGAEERALDRYARELAAEDASDADLERVICECIGRLLPTLRSSYEEVLRKVELEDESVGNAAATLGITANNAGVRLHRARQALRKQVERACGTCATHGCLDCSCGGSTGQV